MNTKEIKVTIGFNEVEYNAKIKELENVATALNESLKLSLIITNNEVSNTDIKEIENWLIKKTGFPNSKANAELLNVGKEFENMIQLLTIYKGYDITLFDYDKNGYKVSKTTLESTTIEFTSYLNDSKVKEYQVLTKITELLNGLAPNSMRYLKTSHTGEISVNTLLLHNSTYGF